jgi:integrase/recombinase XerC
MTARPTLAQAVDRYLGSVEGAGYSAHTLRAYATRLNDLVAFAGEAAPLPMQPELVEAYLASLRRRKVGRREGVSSTTLAHAFAVISGFCRYVERSLRIEPNPMHDVRKPRGETSVDVAFHSLTSAQLDDLLRVAREGWDEHDTGRRDLRTANRRAEDYLLVALMGLAALRVSEACGIDVGDIDGDVVHVLGKGRKRRTVPLPPEVLDGLRDYRPPGGARGHLFGMPRDASRRITPGTIEQRIPRLARAAGIVELRVTPHVLRHTFGSLMLLADPTALIPTRDLMGHESVETTNKYAHTREAERRTALASMHELRRRS